MLKNKKLLLIIIAFLLIVIPLTVYLVSQRITTKKAVFGEITVNLIPTEITKTAGEEFAVEVHLNSGSLPVSAATIGINFPSTLTLTRVVPETGSEKPFTELVTSTASNPFTLVSAKATDQLPQGSFKAATVYFIGSTSETGKISVDLQNTEVIGYNQTNEDVNFNVNQGTEASYTLTGELCQVAACPNITLAHALRTDNKYDINVSWTAPDTANQYIYKIYRNIGAAVPDGNPTANQAYQTINTTYTDANNGSGFDGGITVYYNVDAYQVCQ